MSSFSEGTCSCCRTLAISCSERLNIRKVPSGAPRLRPASRILIREVCASPYLTFNRHVACPLRANYAGISDCRLRTLPAKCNAKNRNGRSVEKAAKALLYSIGKSPFGYSVRELLLRYAEAKHESLEELLSLASELDRHYVPSRYPNAIPSGTPHQSYDEVVSRRALEYATKVIEYVQRQLL